MRPVRVLHAETTHDGGLLRLDLNHPLAALGEKSGAKLVFAEQAQTPTRGVRMQELFDGPGMQVPADDTATTFLQPSALSRTDAVEDTVFYGKPRLTHHLDAVCRAEITALYSDFLQPGMRVLDLMSSWVSHLPSVPQDLQVVGLGMNAAELAANPRLAERVVQDLNQQPRLPWPEARFDRVICTASIEYLTDPLAVLTEVRRVLKPGGQLIVTFSDRWFPTKAIQVWNDLHPFERLGLVLSLLRDAGFNATCTAKPGAARHDRRTTSTSKTACTRTRCSPLGALPEADCQCAGRRAYRKRVCSEASLSTHTRCRFPASSRAIAGSLCRPGPEMAGSVKFSP
jgi:SAM-dependent methyltransferase